MKTTKILNFVFDKIFGPNPSWFLFLLLVGVVLLPMNRCGGSDGNDPIYNDNGVCVANCPTDNGSTDNGIDGKDAEGNDQSADNSADGSTDQAEVEPYVCPSEIPPPEQQEACMPKVAKEAFCKPTTKLCKFGFHEGQPCTTDSFCQQVPDDQWPPCVCWQFCGYEGEWKCDNDFSKIFTLNESTDGKYCDIRSNDGYFHFIGMPNDPPPRYPLDNPENYIELTPEGLDFKGGGSHIFKCIKTD